MESGLGSPSSLRRPSPAQTAQVNTGIALSRPLTDMARAQRRQETASQTQTRGMACGRKYKRCCAGTLHDAGSDGTQASSAAMMPSGPSDPEINWHP